MRQNTGLYHEIGNTHKIPPVFVLFLLVDISLCFYYVAFVCSMFICCCFGMKL